MVNYLTLDDENDKLVLTLNVLHEKCVKIGNHINEIHDAADMNGYNWETLFLYYLTKHNPAYLVGVGTESEADKFVLYAPDIEGFQGNFRDMEKIFTDLLENPDDLYRLVSLEGDLIQWD